MPTYYLDPRQAGTGAAPDVHVVRRTGGWVALRLPERTQLGTLYVAPDIALRAAREAAGFGDVAGQPCGDYQPKHGSQLGTTSDVAYECDECRWSRDAHKGVQS